MRLRALFAVLGLVHCTPPKQPEPGIATSDRELAQRVRALPDLFEQALREERERGGDRYEIQDRLARERSAERRPFVRGMPFRMPARPCSTGAHRIPALRRTIVDPRAGTPRELSLWESELHEAEEHGRALSAEARGFLARLFDVR